MIAAIPPVAYSHHLVELVARAEVAAARLADADPDRRVEAAAHARREASRLSARLDGSPLEDVTADRVDAGWVVDRDGGPPAPGAASPFGWARALKIEGMPTQDVAAIEYANLLACHDAEPALAARLRSEPGHVLADVHRLVCAGLLDEDVAGRLRRTNQAVHDGGQGRVLYNPASPDRLPALHEALLTWLSGPSARMPAVVVSGVVHERILEWLPFEAANGRVARVAARLVLRARGVDPHGCGVAEAELAADVGAYYGEVAATIRRGGRLEAWLERHTAAVAVGLETAAQRIAPRPAPSLPPGARAALVALGPASFTVGDYARAARVSLDQARADLRVLERAGIVRAEPGSSGLRYDVVQDPT